EAAQAERRDERRARLDNRPLAERRVRKRDGEQLVRAQAIVADDVYAAPVAEERGRERGAGLRFQRREPALVAAGAPEQVGHGRQSVDPERVDLDRLAGALR